jgi:hypothetical protein
VFDWLLAIRLDRPELLVWVGGVAVVLAIILLTGRATVRGWLTMLLVASGGALLASACSGSN